MKGIVLAGGHGSRLYPLTNITSKQLLPVYNKPLIFYPMSTLMLAGVEEFLVIVNKEHLNDFKNLLKDGSQLGITIEYLVQEKPNGIAEALIIGESFIGKDDVYLILGDNIFFGAELQNHFESIEKHRNFAHIFGSYVKSPSEFGVVSKDNERLIIEEKPKEPKSNIAVTGLYYYPNKALAYLDQLSPSARGELEITDFNNILIQKEIMQLIELGRGYAWFDGGSPSSLLEASSFIRTIEQSQGLKIGCLEEIARIRNFISKADLENLIRQLPNSEYKDYLSNID
tara:strand:- start:1820 stop:2674 length:855 start_codon:yes stop_codon:yes gene_type:complete